MRIRQLFIGTVVALRATGCKDDAGKASGGQGSSANTKMETSELPQSQGSETKTGESKVTGGQRGLKVLPRIQKSDQQVLSTDTKATVSSGGPPTQSKEEEVESVSKKRLADDEAVKEELKMVLAVLDHDIDGEVFTATLKSNPAVTHYIMAIVSDYSERAAGVYPEHKAKFEAEAEHMNSLLAEFTEITDDNAAFEKGRLISYPLGQLFRTEGAPELESLLGNMAKELKDLREAALPRAWEVAAPKVKAKVDESAKEFTAKHPKYAEEIKRVFAKFSAKMAKSYTAKP